MARKKKKENGNFSSDKLDVWLVKTEKRISNIHYGKDFEDLKPVIIKLLSKIKKEPNLAGFEPRLVLLLKDCNLNLQFIRRDEDCWILLKSGHLKEALEEMIQILKDINAHPDKHLIRPDIKGKILESIKNISEDIESEVKILPHLNLPKSNIKTIKPSTSEQIYPHSPKTTGNTFTPKLEDINPFDIVSPIENPFKLIEDEKIVHKDKSSNIKTYFHPKNPNPDESEFGSNFAPFLGQDDGQKLSEDQMNSINVYWSKEGNKEEKVQNNNFADNKTQKITESNQEEITIDKKKKTDNPWPNS